MYLVAILGVCSNSSLALLTILERISLFICWKEWVFWISARILVRSVSTVASACATSQWTNIDCSFWKLVLWVTTNRRWAPSWKVCQISKRHQILSEWERFTIVFYLVKSQPFSSMQTKVPSKEFLIARWRSLRSDAWLVPRCWLTAKISIHKKVSALWYSSSLSWRYDLIDSTNSKKWHRQTWLTKYVGTETHLVGINQHSEFLVQWSLEW